MPFFSDKLEEFMDYLVRFGLEYYRRYYGPYRAKVISNQDPQGLGRIIVECPRARFSAQNAKWVFPMMHGAGNQYGVFCPPEIGDYVFIFFDNGDPVQPLCYMGGWYADGEVNPKFKPNSDGAPQKRGFATPGGHVVAMSDVSGQEQILIQHKNGTIVKWTSDNKVQMGKDGGSFEPMMKGETVKQWLLSHTHPQAFGPTGPPIEEFPSDGLSSDSETS